ncbi:methylated-DNA--[protein]-cysteine S-methyltransferase [Anaerococcus sp. ENR1011]|uniref:Methylated-DNA--protein-cysteine methyltransferase n=1 Tax=Anaerococcus groningensis TaxID=3115616 RepID=A0ABW9N002_9FIRM
MKTAFYQTDVGIIKITYQEKISKIELVAGIDDKDEKNEITDKVIDELKEYLKGTRKNFTIYDFILLEGTDFQKRVWQELLNIPYGQTKTYKEIARGINNEKATRAVATAIGKNPLMIIIPCHRVIGSDGKLRGYAYGLDVKKKLLALEDNN